MNLVRAEKPRGDDKRARIIKGLRWRVFVILSDVGGPVRNLCRPLRSRAFSPHKCEALTSRDGLQPARYSQPPRPVLNAQRVVTPDAFGQIKVGRQLVPALVAITISPDRALMHAKSFGDIGVGEERPRHRSEELDRDVPDTPELPPDVLPGKAAGSVGEQGFTGHQRSDVSPADPEIVRNVPNLRKAWACGRGHRHRGLCLEAVGGRHGGHATPPEGSFFALVATASRARTSMWRLAL